MSPVHLLADTLTFLSFLHTRPVRPRGRRWLPPSALADLDPQLHLRDHIRPAGRPQGGRLGPTERDTTHIRFIHFLCEAAHLVARTGSHLKPTLRVSRWLAAAPLDQLRLLFDAAHPAQPHRPHDELWQTYRLPGCGLASPTLSLAPLFDILRQMPADERLKLSTLLKLVPLPDDAGESPEAVLRGVLQQLALFGIVQWRGASAVQLTPLGLHLLSRPDAGPVLLPPMSDVQLDLPGIDSPLTIGGECVTFAGLYQLAEYAQLISISPVRRYRLERDRVQRALQRGHTLVGLLDFFESLLGDAPPRALTHLMADWAAQLDRVTIRHVTLLEVRDPATLTDLTRSHRLRESLSRTLSPRAVLIRPARLPALIRQLQQRGLTPRLLVSNTNMSYSGPNALSHYDAPALAQLYYAAFLNHQLADRLTAPCRVDYSIVLDLEHRLTPHDRDLAQALAVEAAQQLTAAPGAWPAADLPPDQLPAPDRLPTLIRAIQHAIDIGQPLTFSYHSPAYGCSTRTVEPLRLEWHGDASRADVPYLIAFCRLRQAERTFRVDRIGDLRAA